MKKETVAFSLFFMALGVILVCCADEFIYYVWIGFPQAQANLEAGRLDEIVAPPENLIWQFFAVVFGQILIFIGGWKLTKPVPSK